jgi:hypothetical protein
VAGFLIIIAVMLVVCGIILQVVVRKNREIFELMLTAERERGKNA